MSNLKRLLAGACWMTLWSGSLLSAEPPVLLFPQSPTEASDVTQRLDQLQDRLEWLEAENGQLRQSMFQSQNGQSHGVTPANAEMWNANAEAACPPTCQCPNCAPAEDGKGDWKTGWNHGIEWISPDKAFKAHIGGRTQFDGVWIHQQPGALTGAGGGVNGRFDRDAVVIRRARLRADGTIYETIDYAAEFDFANAATDAGQPGEPGTDGVTAPTDLWFTFKELPWVGNLRIGNLKEPIGFEHAISSRYLNFLERSYNQDLFYGAFNNGFTPGVMIFNTWAEEHGTWWIGGFKNGRNIYGFDVGDGEYAATGRVTYCPIFDHDNETVLHLGIAGSVRDPDDGQGGARFRARSLRNGPATLATVYADTGNFNADTQWLGAVEAAGVWHSLSWQAEWTGSWLDDTSNNALLAPVTKGTATGDIFVQGWYVEMHYFLTGESREYERKNGAFGRVIPHRNARWKSGCFEPGAWQLAFRYENADLDDKGLQGGLLQAYTVGLNWFLNPNLKIQWNYVCTERTSIIDGVDDGLTHGFGMRLAHDF